jgi:hypothetical protein
MLQEILPFRIALEPDIDHQQFRDNDHPDFPVSYRLPEAGVLLAFADPHKIVTYKDHVRFLLCPFPGEHDSQPSRHSKMRR